MTINTVAGLRTASPTPGAADHGGLTGLTDDDHAQYALLAGRSAGQTLIGGTVAADRLYLQGSTQSGGSRGDVFVNGRLRFTDLADAATSGAAGAYSNIYCTEAVTTGAAGWAPSVVAANQNWSVGTIVFLHATISLGSVYTQTALPLFSACMAMNLTPLLTTALTTGMGSIAVQFQPTIRYTGATASSINYTVAVASAQIFDAGTTSGSDVTVDETIGLDSKIQWAVPTNTSLDIAYGAGVRVRTITGTSTGTATISSWYGLHYEGLAGLDASTQAAGVYSLARHADDNQYNLLTTGDASLKAANNEFIGGGTTVAHGLSFPIVSNSISADEDDYDGAGFAATDQTQRTYMLMAAVSANRTITGIDRGDGNSGQQLIITNRGVNDIILSHQDAASGSLNRITSPTGANYTLTTHQSAILLYDDVILSNWRIIAGSGT